MSRLRVPFRSKQSSTAIPTDTPSISTTIPTPVIEIPEKDADPPTLQVEKGKESEVERLWGLENFGNTCYCNSVLQALYACDPFRQFVASYPDPPAPITPLAPGPGEANKPKPSPSPGSPLAVKTGNPFDNPNLNGTNKRNLFGRRPTSSAATPIVPAAPAPTYAPILTSRFDSLPIAPNPNGPQPSVFETIQTLFHHLTASLPHQPLPAKKDAKANPENAQTASLLPSEEEAQANPNGNGPPPGPPLLASLPPPSAPRGGGPFQAGTLGRGVVRPEDLLKTVKRENEMFRGMSQQDAHEFLGWVLNKVAEDIDVVDRSLRDVGKGHGNGKSFVQNLFEGVLTNETRCLSCETTSSRDELFLDLSIDIEQHTSVTACLRQFSTSEMLCQKNKFFCDSCCGLQEAEKRMKIKRLPNILALHLKRFKYQESLGRYTKLFYRVPFPLQLRLPNTSDETENPDRLYELFAVVVHIGNGPHHGHYVCLIKSGGRWVMCDDENVEPIEEQDIYRYFGDYPSGAGYVLFYQAADLDLSSLGLRTASPASPEQPTASAMGGLINIDEAAERSPTIKQASVAPIPSVAPALPKVSPVAPALPPARPSAPTVAQSAPVAPVVPVAPVAPVAPIAPVAPAPIAPVALVAPISPPAAAPVAFIQPRRANSNLAPGTPPPARAVDSSPATPTPVVPATPPVVHTPTPASRETPSIQQVRAVPSPVPTSTPPLPPSQPVSGPNDDKWYRRKSNASEQPPLVRNPSQRDRTVSSSSQASNDKYSGGGGLSRRLSGISVSKIGRSGSMSFGKLGFGKKDKGITE